MRRPTPQVRITLGVCKHSIWALTPRKEDRPTMDVSKERPRLTAGVDLGDKYSYLCLLHTDGGEMIEEGLLCEPLQKL